MSDNKFPLLDTGRDEEMLFFSGSPQEQACIGHLRGDFGRGTEFWTTWWDHQRELKGQDFRDELNDLVNTLRENGPLKDLRAMERFCWEHPSARMSLQAGSEYFGFRVDTARHRYYLRFFPQRGNYNFYIYCYQTDKFERTTAQMGKEDSMDENMIKVLIVEPMQPCRVQEIPDTLDAMQGIVGGDIEAAYPFQEPVAVVCNAEGKMLDLPYNRPLMDENGLPYDIVCGTFFMAGVGTEDFVSLTDEQVQRYKELYDNVVVIPAEKEQPHQEKSDQKKKRGNQHER